MFLIILVSVVVWFVFYPWWIFFTCHILMHFHTLFFPSLLLFWVCVCVCVCVCARVCVCGCFPFFYSKIFLTMAPKVKKSIPSKILSLDMLLLPFLLFHFIYGFVTQNPRRILTRNFLARQFMLNARSSYLIFQILCYPDHLDHVLRIPLWKTR